MKKKDKASKSGENPKKKKSHRATNFILVLILLVGAGIAGYPAFSDYWNSMHQSRAIMGYAERVAELSNEEYKEVLDAALDYNRQLADSPNQWKMNDEQMDDYDGQLNVDGTGNMGFISIPKIDVNLPIYHGTSDAVLQVMRKPPFEQFRRFKAVFDRVNQRYGLRQQLIPYFISSHPGCREEDMAELAVLTKELDFHLEQVQDFTPTPMTVATECYYTGVHPYTLQPVYTARSQEEKLAQRQ